MPTLDEPMTLYLPLKVAAEALEEVPDDAPDFVRQVTAVLLRGDGDLLPVSAMPVDGTFPTGTAQWEKRSIAEEIPIWDPSICIDCARCALVCPHAAIRIKAFDPAEATPEGFAWKESATKDLEGWRIVVQVAPDDCTGCGVCVDVCPAKSKEMVKHKAINMLPKLDHLDRGQSGLRRVLQDLLRRRAGQGGAGVRLRAR